MIPVHLSWINQLNYNNNVYILFGLLCWYYADLYQAFPPIHKVRKLRDKYIFCSRHLGARNSAQTLGLPSTPPMLIEYFIMLPIMLPKDVCHYCLFSQVSHLLVQAKTNVITEGVRPALGTSCGLSRRDMISVLYKCIILIMI